MTRFDDKKKAAKELAKKVKSNQKAFIKSLQKAKPAEELDKETDSNS